jgi:2-polyprenyl-3-methyl-5-hydroxy-6-metoxy-1,4-benzoquinol methylase
MQDLDYARGLRDYYNHPANPVHLNRVSDKAREVDTQFTAPGHWRRELALAMRRVLRGRRVLEIACGTGIWTRLILDVAESVLATDVSPRILARAKRLVRLGKRIPADRLRFLQLDAYDLISAPGQFDAALAINWFQHVPSSRHAEFLDSLHKKLRPGATVFLATSHRSREWQANLFCPPGEPDSYSVRLRSDGSQYQVIDNLFNKGELSRIFAPVARRLRFRSAQAYSWMTYQIRTERR